MNKERQRRIFEIVDRAQELSGSQREDFLASACGDDAALRRDVENLLVDSEASPILVQPAFSVHAEDGAVGRRLGPYRLVELLDRGGMGSVYRAERDDFDKQVALKLIRRGLDGDVDLVRRFENERQILAHLDHPYIARLLDGGATDDQLPYFVMELVAGQPIDTYCETQRLSVEERLLLFRKVCGAVHFAHQNLVIHRDLKPGNILIGDDGQPKLLDFGIAKLMDDSRAAQPLATVSGQGLMTPRYASPEQIRQQPLTTASDVYSLGVLLYELLTGVDPYDAKERRPDEISRAICEEEPPRPSTAVKRRLDPTTPQGRRLRRRLSGDLDSIILKAMRKEPGQRYGSAEELSQDIERHLEGLTVNAREGTLGYRASKFVRRHLVPLTVMTAFLVLTVGLGIFSWFQWQRAELAKQEAEKTLILLVDVFREADPAEGKTDLTPRDMLKAAVTKASDGSYPPNIRFKILTTLGQAFRNLGESDEARAVFETACQVAEKAPLDRDALEVCQVNIAVTYQDAEEYGEAERRFRAILERRKVAGQKGSKLWKAESNLAASLTRQGKFEEATALYSKIHQGRLTEYGAGSHQMIASHLNLGDLYFSMGNPVRTLEEAELALQIILGKARRNEVYHSTALNLKANALAALGRESEARELYEESLKVRNERFGAISVAITQKNLAAVLIESDPERAEELLAKAIKTLDARPNSWLRADAQSVLGALWTSQGQFAEAEPLLLAAHRKLAEVRGADAYPTVKAWDRRIALYDAWGRPEDARRLRDLRPSLPADGVSPADGISPTDDTGDSQP